MSESKYAYDLQMFAEASASAAPAGEAQGSTQTEFARPSRRAERNPLANVKYGVQETNTASPSGEKQEEAPTKSREERQKEFDAYIKANKDLYDEGVQGIVKDRLKNTKAKADLVDQLSPIADLLSEKYGTEKGNYKALMDAAKADLANFETEALKRGMEPEMWREVRDKELTIKAFQDKEDAEKRKAQEEEQVQRWLKEADEVKGKFPEFNLEAELQNDTFKELFGTGKVSMERAYVQAHMDELIPDAMQYAAKKGEALVVERIKSRGSRPTETGISSNSPAVDVKTDVSTLTKADRKEIVRRVAKGEKVSFV